MQNYRFALKRVRSFAQRTPRFHKWNLAMTIGYKIMDCHDFLRSLAMTKCNPSVIAPPHFRHCERSEAHICVSKFAHTCKSIILYKAIFTMESLNKLKKNLNFSFFIRGQGVLLAKRPPYPLKPPTPRSLHRHYCADRFRHCPPSVIARFRLRNRGNP